MLRVGAAMNQGLCPKFDQLITSVQVDDITINVYLTPTWKGSSYYCPKCKAILGVSMNPLNIAADSGNRIVDRLRAS